MLYLRMNVCMHNVVCMRACVWDLIVCACIVACVHAGFHAFCLHAFMNACAREHAHVVM